MKSLVEASLVAAVLWGGWAAPAQTGESENAAPPPAAKPAGPTPEFPPFAEVARDFEKVVPRQGDAPSLYTIWLNRKAQQMLAELPRGAEGQKIFIATSIAGGSRETGWQWRELYGYWSRHDRRMVLMEPQLLRRAQGSAADEELKLAVRRTWNDRVVTSVAILTTGPGGGPVVDLDALLVGNSALFTGLSGDAALARIGEIKAFPRNLEIPVTIPMGRGELTTLHYSISAVPSTDYQPRESDERVGYFLTVFKDLTRVDPDGRNFVRYINRWNLRKRDASLALSPPAEPIVFYIEHTVPVRYRRYVRDGILEWNQAFERVGLLDALEVRQQDARTGAFMDVDPEDVRYNFFRWISSERAFAMGPSRVNPETGEILDADIVFDDSMLKYYALAWRQRIAAYGLDGVDPQALAWMEERPAWDPLRAFDRADPSRDAILADPALDAERKADLLGVPHAPRTDELLTRMVQQNRYCGYAAGRALQMQTAGLALRLLGADGGGDAPGGDAPTLDGVPEEYLGAILKEIVMHEVGHTLGLRHNFKASAWLSLQEYAGRRGRAAVGSVMDYNPIHVPADPQGPRGDWVTPTLGPYDYWAIEHGYATDDKQRQEIVRKVASRELQYATDEDADGPDPLVARFDLGADPLAWAEERLRLVRRIREKLLDGAVRDGQSWHLLREAYEVLLAEQLGAIRVAGRCVGGVHVHRDRKGDPDARDPLVPVDAEVQRRALRLVAENAFREEAFDLRPAVLARLAADKHRHWGNPGAGEEAFPVHDRIAQIQGFALLYLLNPGTLSRVYDNELRVEAGADALTLPEVIGGVADEVFGDLRADPAGREFDNRAPVISGLRRNLQSQLVARLVDLALDPGWMPPPVPALARGRLESIRADIARLLGGAGAPLLDDYTRSHLADLAGRIEKALEAVYIAR